MRWASTVSVEDGLDDAVEDAAATIREDLDGEIPDLAVVFVSRHHEDVYDQVPQLVRKALGGGLVIGCSAGGVIGGGTEIEGQAGLSMTAASLPEVELAPFHLQPGELPAKGAGGKSWESLLRVPVEKSAHFLLLPDPLTFESEDLLTGLDAAYPYSKKIGGLASGGSDDEPNALFVGASVYRAGAVGVALCGNIEVDTVVAQGCRPIGDPVFVTGVQRNIVTGLDGRSPLDVLREIHAGLSDDDQELFRHSLFLGIVMDAKRQEYAQGDFLVRNLLGMDEDTGAIAVGALMQENAVVQFHLRDAKTSADDLSALLSRYADTHVIDATRPEGSLLFSCLGRGSGLYGRPDHDTDAFRRYVGEIPLGGFFCNGEIGDLHGRTFLHGYTSSFGVFRSRASA